LFQAVHIIEVDIAVIAVDALHQIRRPIRRKLAAVAVA
jgi:hypothetical protein